MRGASLRLPFRAHARSLRRLVSGRRVGGVTTVCKADVLETHIGVLLSSCWVSTAYRILALWSVRCTTWARLAVARAHAPSSRWERCFSWCGHLDFSAFPSFPCLLGPRRSSDPAADPPACPYLWARVVVFLLQGRLKPGYDGGKRTVAFTESCFSPCIWNHVNPYSNSAVKYYLKEETKKDCMVRHVRVFEPEFLGLGSKALFFPLCLVCPLPLKSSQCI